MMKRTVLSAILCMMAAAMTGSPVEMQTSGTTVTLEFFTPSIVRVVKSPIGHTYEKQGLVVIAQPDDVRITRKGHTVSSDVLTVSLDAKTGALTFTAKGKTLLREKGKCLFEPRTTGPDSGAYRITQCFQLDKEEAIYGLGTFQNGKINRRGEHKLMEQSNLEDFQNVLQSIKGWGIYWDNYSRTQFDDDAAKGMSFSSEVGDCVDYYFMYGGSADGVIAQMRHLSGDVPMFPLWTYGFWQCKERYKSAAELLGVVDQYRALQVPLDGIVQDWQYWGSNYLWNAMDFLTEEYANGEQMIRDVHQKHAHFMISIWASFGPKTKAYRQLDEKGLLFDFETWPQSGLTFWPPRMDYPSGVRVYDAFSPEARDIYWQHLKPLLDKGTDAWWMDSTDPDFFNPKESDYDHRAGANGTWRSLRNAFPLETVKGVYHNQRQTEHQKRVFIMTRSAFAGQQHYREIWQFGKRGEPVYDAIESQIRLRYRLIPYLYSTAWQVTSNNESYLRPLFSDFAADKKVWNMTDEFMFGRSILAAPILDPQYTQEILSPLEGDGYKAGGKMENGELIVDWNAPKAVTKYLPKGTLWYDFWTGKSYRGGQSVTLQTSLDRVPMFVRAGSILPLGPEMQYTGEKPWDNLELRLYPGADGTFTLYEDEGDTYRYEQGVYATIRFNWNDKVRTLTIAERQGSYPGMLSSRQFTVTLPDGTTKTISYHGHPVTLTL